MTEGDRGIVDQIKAYRDQLPHLRMETVTQIGLQDEEAWMEEKDELPLFKSSFSTFQPVIEPLLHEIKDTYLPLVVLTQNRVQVSTFEPRITESGSHAGHFALIWGSQSEPWGAQQVPIDRFVKTQEKLTSVKRISKRKKRKLEMTLDRYGETIIVVPGFNAFIAIAEVEKREGLIVPVVKLITNYRDETGDGFTVEEVAKGALIPDLSQALDPTSGYYGEWSFYPRVRTYVAEGPKNIFPTGPFV